MLIIELEAHPSDSQYPQRLWLRIHLLPALHVQRHRAPSPVLPFSALVTTMSDTESVKGEAKELDLSVVSSAAAPPNKFSSEYSQLKSFTAMPCTERCCDEVQGSGRDR